MSELEQLLWILAGGVIMSAVAMSGSVSVLMPPAMLQRVLLPLVALAAGTLLGGAFFHMLPEATTSLTPLPAAVWAVAGFTVFLLIEQFLHWHHGHSSVQARHQPFTVLILIGDALHNFLGGLAIASTFLISPHAGIVAWFAALAHEIPQELGDFGVLVHGGWSRSRALLWNFVSALTFPAGAVLAWALAGHVDVAGLVAFGAGNFVYIAASDLIPEIKSETSIRAGLVHFAFFFAGLALIFAIAVLPFGGS